MNRDTFLTELRRLERAARPLEPGSAKRKKLLGAANATAERFLRTISTRKSFEEAPDQGAGLLDAPISDKALPLKQVIAHFEHDVVRPGAGTATGGHLAYIPGGGLYHSAVGDFLAAVTNKYASIFFTGPGPVRMENMLVRWTADLVGFPPEAGGALVSGGSIANLSAIAAARDARSLMGSDFGRAVVYLTSQAHHSIAKALKIIGMAEAPIRRVAMDDRWRMKPDALAEAIATDRAAGLIPWLVVAAAGTTDTGAVDPLDAIAAVAERERCWLHVDAAYGGYFLLTDDGKAIMRGIERADSVTLDPHKTLFLPYGCGMVIARKAATLAATHSLTGHYMQDALEGAGEASPADLSPELSKHFRALRMWLPLILLGVKPFRAALEEKLLLARYFRMEVKALGFEVGPEPDLSVVTYRWVPAGWSVERANAFNKAIIEGAQRDGRVFLSSTMLDGKYTLRMAAVTHRTHRRTIDLALTVLREQVTALS